MCSGWPTADSSGAVCEADDLLTVRTLSVVHIAAPAPVGGLERVVQSLAVGQRRAGHLVTVIAVLASDADDHPFSARLRGEGVAVEELRLSSTAYVQERRVVRALLRRQHPDVVHTHGYRCDLIHGGVARALGIPIVSTLHGSSRLGGRSQFFEWLQLRALKRFDAVVAVSSPLSDLLHTAGVSRERVALIPNAWPGVEPALSRVEARARLGVGVDDFVIGFVGRLIRAKGPDVLLRALAALPDGPWHAVIVGDGGERAALEASKASERVRARVTFTGHLDDATHLYAGFDVFVLSSRTEGTPIALFEAMAASTPVVATRVGGVPEVLSAQDGLLVESEDSGAIAVAIREIREQPAAAAGRAAHARARVVREFGTASWLERHLDLYRRIGRPTKVAN